MKSSIVECEEELQKALGTPRIAQLLKSINPSPIISCLDCNDNCDTRELQARALIRDSQPLQIDLCANKLPVAKVEEALIHELIHAFDFSQHRCDFLNCEGLAYSEVRAAKFGECDSYRISQWLKRKCIRHHAIKSTENLFPRDATRCVDRVLIEAIEDNEPFVDQQHTKKLVR